MEVAARQVQTIVDAYQVAGKALNWQLARYFAGATSAVDAIAPDRLASMQRARVGRGRRASARGVDPRIVMTP